MYFKIKTILKNNCYYTLKHPIDEKNFFLYKVWRGFEREKKKYFFIFIMNI